jgi:hypothetical protein
VSASGAEAASLEAARSSPSSRIGERARAGDLHQRADRLREALAHAVMVCTARALVCNANREPARTDATRRWAAHGCSAAASTCVHPCTYFLSAARRRRDCRGIAEPERVSAQSGLHVANLLRKSSRSQRPPRPRCRSRTCAA